jgi:pilus assembly protein CpaF
LEPFINDPTVTEIMVNRGGRDVFIERNGLTERTTATVTAKGLENAIKRIARFCQDEVDDRQPKLDARLEDGSRVAALLQPCSVDGCTMTIRKFGQRYSLHAMVANGSVPAAIATALSEAVRDRRNILISGSTGSGKTSLLNALANPIPVRHRILLIEDTSEIAIDDAHHVVRFESRETQLKMGEEDPAAAVTIDPLLRHALRHRPDRIILGEVRGAEAWSLLQALNTGHRGSLHHSREFRRRSPHPPGALRVDVRHQIALPEHP